VENEPDVNEKDEIVRVELTVKLFTVISPPVIDDAEIVDPVSEVKYPFVIESVGTRTDERTVKEDVT
jgi:hypothetical protein